MSSFGDLFGIVSDHGMGSAWLVLPIGYSSGLMLNGQSRFVNMSLSDLGLNPVIRTWAWGSGMNSDRLILKVNADPVPAPLPCLGAAVAWKFARKLRGRCLRQSCLNI